MLTNWGLTKNQKSVILSLGESECGVFLLPTPTDSNHIDLGERPRTERQATDESPAIWFAAVGNLFWKCGDFQFVPPNTPRQCVTTDAMLTKPIMEVIDMAKAQNTTPPPRTARTHQAHLFAPIPTLRPPPLAQSRWVSVPPPGRCGVAGGGAMTTAELQTLARDVALNLSMLDTARTWTRGRLLHSSSLVLDANDGHGLTMSMNGESVRVSGRYPLRNHDNTDLIHSNETPPAIGVGIGRGAQTIAREIYRRLMPGYLKARAVAQERYIEYLADVALIKEAVPRLADAWGGNGCCEASITDRDPCRGVVRLPYSSNKPHGNLEVSAYQSGQVTIELRGLSVRETEALGLAFRAIVDNSQPATAKAARPAGAGAAGAGVTDVW